MSQSVALLVLLALLEVDVVVRVSDGGLEVGPGHLHAADAVLCHHQQGLVGVVAVAKSAAAHSGGRRLAGLRGAYMLISSVASLPTMCRMASLPPGWRLIHSPRCRTWPS